MKLLHVITYYLLGIVAILFISVFPQYFSRIGLEDSPGYFKQLFTFMIEFVNPDSWVFGLPDAPSRFPLLEVLWEPYIYSMKILGGALIIGFTVALILAFVAVFLPGKVLEFIKKGLNLLEAVPDLIIATLLQVFAIYIYKLSGITIFNVAGYTEQVLLAPIITLAIIPMVSMFKILILMIEEEFLKVYVNFARSKGIDQVAIVFKHVLKNIMPISFHHMKIIIWGTLSSQFIIERVFNVHGLTFYLLESFTPITVAVTLILIFTPFYFLFQIIDIWLKNEVKTYKLRQGALLEGWYPRNVAGSVKRRLDDFLYSVKHFQRPKVRLFHAIGHLFRVFGTHMKNWKFAVGCLFFIVTIGYSFIYSITTDNHVDQTTLLYEEDGVTLIGRAPFGPTDPYLLGTDRLGFSLFDQLVIGAKYTLFFALIIAFLRVFGGLLFGVFYAFRLSKNNQQRVSKMIDSIHFLPLSLIAYVLLAPILMPTMQGFAYTFTERIFLEILILTVLVVPLTTVLLGKEMSRVLEYEFISSAKVLGGSKFHLFWRHLVPHLGARLTILFGQQFIQVLLIFIHLGVFNFFFGGTLLTFGDVPDPPRSMTYEWSGLIGQIGRSAIASGRYWYLFIMLAFMLAIFAMQLIIQGVKEVQQEKVGVRSKVAKKRKNRQKEVEQTFDVSKSDFELIRKRQKGA